MTTKILRQMEEPQPYGHDDDFLDDHQDSPHNYNDGSGLWENPIEDDLHNIENHMEE